MKKIFLIIIAFGFLFSSCKKVKEVGVEGSVSNNPEIQQPVATCGMEEVMANISPEFRNKVISRSRLIGQAPALLIYLDFDGAIVIKGYPNATYYSSPIIRFGRVDCAPARLSEERIQEIVQLVKDDFSPFNIEVTTSQVVYDRYTPENKQLCIITASRQQSVVNVSGFLLGVAPGYGPGIRSPFDPSFVFSTVMRNNKEIAGVISHEVGHTLGLMHQSQFNIGLDYLGQDCLFLSEYNIGFGTNTEPLAFVPIMGNVGTQRRIDNWFAQPCQTQNDFVFINNKVVLRPDDFPNNFGGRVAAPSGTRGVLETGTDVDFLYLRPRSPGPVSITSENIDLKVTLYNMAGRIVSEYNDPNDTGVIIPEVKGVCYIKVEGVSNANMSSQFMTGQYLVSY